MSREPNRICWRCNMMACHCGKVLTYYGIYSHKHGNGPLRHTLGEAEQERRDMLANDPSDMISICYRKMLAEEYAKLPKHPLTSMKEHGT